MHNYTFTNKAILKLAHLKKYTFLIAAMLLLAITATAQVPTNDEPCSGTANSAITLIADAACTFQTFSFHVTFSVCML